MRPQEALAIRGVDYKDGMLKIRAWGDWKIKTGQDRSIEVNAIAREILDRRKREMDDDALPLFHSKKNTRRGPREAYHALKNWLKKNIKEKDHRPPWGPYDMRHYFCSQAAARGWPIEKLAAYVGHASATTLERWYLDRRALTRGIPPVLTEESD